MAAYDLEKAAKTLTKESLKTRIPTLWRYAEVLPVENERKPHFTRRRFYAAAKSGKSGRKIDLPNLYIKDESPNPTQKF